MKFINRILFALVLVAVGTEGAFADVIQVATFNTRFLFKPGNSRAGGQITPKGPQTIEQYQQKIANISKICRGQNLVSVQEIGSNVELSDLGAAAGMETLFTQGRDTYTGEDVGILYRLPDGWKLEHFGRIPDLDRIVSKHLLAVFETPSGRVAFLAIHLLRPLGQNEQKHQKQVAAIAKWAAESLLLDSRLTIIIAGDTNNTKTEPIFGVGVESGEIMGWPNTMVSERRVMPIDRIVVAGAGTLASARVMEPPIGRRPNELNLILWSDHCGVLAEIQK